MTFWSRTTIPWKLSCDDKHSRSSVIKAAEFEKDKEPLNAGVVMILLAIAYAFGFIISFATFCMFLFGKWSRGNMGM